MSLVIRQPVCGNNLSFSSSVHIPKSVAAVWVIKDKYGLKCPLFGVPESFQRTFPVQINDVTLCPLNNTPASHVISQDHIELANRLPLTNNVVNVIHPVPVLCKGHSPVFSAKTMFIFLRAHILFYFTKAFIITDFLHIMYNALVKVLSVYQQSALHKTDKKQIKN